MTIIDCLKLLLKEDDVNPLSPEEIRVYITLLKEWNKQTRPEWFEYCLIPKVGANAKPNAIPKSTVIRIRERLQKRGLIQYVSGNGKVKNPLFKICGGTKHGTLSETNVGTIDKEKVSPTPPLKENITELREKERITKVIPKKEEDLAFCLPSYVPIMQTWLKYKKERGQAYKPMGVKACYGNLLKLSGGNPTIAQMIVEQSIANNYQGLYELKNNEGRIQNSTHASFTTKQEANEYAINQFIQYREARESGLLDEVEKPF